MTSYVLTTALLSRHRGQAENFPVLHATAVLFDLPGGITEPEEGLDVVRRLAAHMPLQNSVPTEKNTATEITVIMKSRFNGVIMVVLTS